ncbi:MAG: hypothetical protein ACRDY7_09170 [Acidimicrobiia bacterium]
MSSPYPLPPASRRPVRWRAGAAILAGASLLGALTGFVGAQTAFRVGIGHHKPTWGTNRVDPVFAARVWDTVTHEDIVYMAGEFTAIAPVIERAGGIDGSSGLPTAGFPTINPEGEVKVAIPDDRGGWYIGGSFSEVGGQTRRGLAHINADGSLDQGWDPGLLDPARQATGSFTVLALAKQGDLVYIGGEFAKFAGSNAMHVARVGATTGTVDETWKPEADGPVHALAVSPDHTRIYMAGQFGALNASSAAPVARPGIAAVDTVGNVVEWAPPVGAVRAMAVSADNSRIYVGGDTLAAIDPNGAMTWRADGGDVTTLALSRDGVTVYAGGGFSSVGGVPRVRLAALNAASGAVDAGWNPDADGAVSSVSVSDDGTMVYVGGDFGAVRGQPRSNLAAVNAATGALEAWDPNANDKIDTLAASGGQVYAAGTFTTLGAQSRTQLGAINAVTGGPHPWAPKLQNLDSDGSPAAEPPVVVAVALSSDASKVYIGGTFSHVLGADGKYLPRTNLAAVDRVSGFVDPGFNPGTPQGGVRALRVRGNTLYAGGSFKSVRISGSTHGIGRPDNPCRGQSDCQSLGGAGNSSEWIRHGLVAAFDATTGFIDERFNQVPEATGCGLTGQGGDDCTTGNGVVRGMAVSPDGRYLYVGGTFSCIGSSGGGDDCDGQFGMYSADAVTGRLTSWQPDTGGIPIFDVAISPSDGRVLVTAAGGAGGKVQRYVPHDMSLSRADDPGEALCNDDSQCEPLWQAETDGDSTSVDISANTIYSGGHYTRVNDVPHKHAAALDFNGNLAENWDVLFDTSEGVFSVEVVPGRMVVVAGNFSQAGMVIDHPTKGGKKFDAWKAQPGVAIFPGTP